MLFRPTGGGGAYLKIGNNQVTRYCFNSPVDKLRNGFCTISESIIASQYHFRTSCRGNEYIIGIGIQVYLLTDMIANTSTVWNRILSSVICS